MIKKIFNKMKVVRQRIIEYLKVEEKKRKVIYNNIKFTKEQIKLIQLYYKRYYGKKIPLNWHKLYFAVSGKFDYKYFPELLFIPEFERLCNNPDYYKTFQDKNVLALLINNLTYVKYPKIHIKCIGDVFLDSNNHIISRKEVVKILTELKKFFIKPSKNTNSGKMCKIYDIKDDSEFSGTEKIEKILQTYKKDFLIQDILDNCDELKRLHPASINTFRLMTYILGDKIFHCPLVLRMGRNGNHLDNVHTGGIFIGVNDDGSLLDCALTEFGDKYFSHPDTNIVFKGYKINKVPEMINVAYQLQQLFPQIKCINWDFTINEKNEIVLVEANMKYGGVWMIQMAHGKSLFGDNTEIILQKIKDNKNLF